MKRIGPLAILFWLILGSLPPVGKAEAQAPVRVQRFQPEAVSPIPAWPDGELCADRSACVRRTFLGGIAGYMLAGVVMTATVPLIMGACWEGCPPVVGAAWFVPLAILPGLGMHLGSRRSGNIWITTTVSAATLAAGAALAHRDGYADGGSLVATLAAQFLFTGLAEILGPAPPDPGSPR